ncbi:MAG: class II fumarate hydratase [Bacteroidales bacterium]
MDKRIESDSLGEIRVPLTALYGAQTQRAVENFPVSELRLQEQFIISLALIKKNAARVNGELGLIDLRISDAVEEAAQELIDGKHKREFVVDVFQTGSGTSTNMNMNEVIAGRANQILSAKELGGVKVHPNDHVNLCQSSNDVIPSALNIAVSGLVENELLPSLGKLKESLYKKSRQFAGIEKLGRTHLQDAVVMTLGDEFSAYAVQVEKDIDRLNRVKTELLELSIGGTAVGTGINAHPEFAPRVIELIAADTGIDFRETDNHFASQASQDSSVAVSGVLNATGVSLTKIANDIRWLSSGPRAGLGEINLPAVQPGSSIMPGKVNPVIPEAVLQVAAQLTGNDATITAAAKAGNFELNTMLPLIAYNLIQSTAILASVSGIFASKCIDGISADADKCRSNVENSLDVAVKLIPYTGYDKASEIAGKAYEQGKTVKEVVREEGILTDEQMKKVF